jgi:hypothetical protein
MTFESVPLNRAARRFVKLPLPPKLVNEDIDLRNTTRFRRPCGEIALEWRFHSAALNSPDPSWSCLQRGACRTESHSKSSSWCRQPTLTPELDPANRPWTWNDASKHVWTTGSGTRRRRGPPRHLIIDSGIEPVDLCSPGASEGSCRRLVFRWVSAVSVMPQLLGGGTKRFEGSGCPEMASR